MMSSRAAVLTAPRTIILKDFAIPDIGDDEILVKVEGCGICGTDVHEYRSDPLDLLLLFWGMRGPGLLLNLEPIFAPIRQGVR